ncbi:MULTISPECIES: hypothetical protein [unclassified Erythrobacter]|uniref:hypothetical protein n=1 Tax=unclassified Erythrobacter TaxID=2633097 RepID=UPI0030C77052
MRAGTTRGVRGAPLVVLALVLGAWVSGRAMMWENPFPVAFQELVPGIDIASIDGKNGGEGPDLASGSPFDQTADPMNLLFPRLAIATMQPGIQFPERLLQPIERGATPLSPAVAAGHQLLMAAAFNVDWLAANTHPAWPSRSTAPRQRQASAFGLPAQSSPQSADRWSLDAFAFYRAGSGSNSISQGRVPVYGASQIALNLQHRLGNAGSHDPRVFVRAYRAFVPDGEQEIAGGFSARPVGKVPVRAFAEVRLTQNSFGTDIRPAAYVVTELAPASLPLDFTLETYAGAGYVGGEAATGFVDGQIAATREIARFEGHGGSPVRVSLGAASWGGAQKDASRIDVGPTMRIDLSVGEVPARISLDWRERVGGDAAPDAGLAATISTRF